MSETLLEEVHDTRGTEVCVRRVGNDAVLSSAPPAGADVLIDALMAFEHCSTLQREQPAPQQWCAPRAAHADAGSTT